MPRGGADEGSCSFFLECSSCSSVVRLRETTAGGILLLGLLHCGFPPEEKLFEVF